jgi:hypothetical protein
MGHGLKGVFEQAVGYVKKLGLVRCRQILLTQGGRFYVFSKIGKSFRKDPAGYVNIEKIRTQHFVPESTNAVDTIVSLGPMNA